MLLFGLVAPVVLTGPFEQRGQDLQHIFKPYVPPWAQGWQGWFRPPQPAAQRAPEPKPLAHTHAYTPPARQSLHDEATRRRRGDDEAMSRRR